MTEETLADLASARELHQVFDRLFDASPLALATIGPDFRFQRVNQRLCDLLGYSREELMSLTFPQITHPEDIGKSIHLAAKAFNNEIPYYTLEKRYVTKSGESAWVNLTASYIQDDRGEPIVGLAMIDDISGRKAAEERFGALNRELTARVAELEVASEHLATANKELETFSATVSHDLKGPLVSISQFSHALLGRDHGPLTAAQVDLLRRIRNAGRQARNIIDDLRDLADVSRRELLAEDVDISSMAQQIIADHRGLAPDRDVTLAVQPGLRVHGDPALIRLLVANLLENAWKYTGREERASIEVTGERGPVRNVVHIADNGIGFDNMHRERIFEAFERLHTDDEFGGTGLGLATARRVARRHGGEVWAEGRPAHGATFSFSI